MLKQYIRAFRADQAGALQLEHSLALAVIAVGALIVATQMGM